MMGSLVGLKSTTSSSGAIKTTPLLQNLWQPSFCYLSLKGISVGGNRLSVKKSRFELQNDRTGGLIIDSGTAITYLELSAFDLVKEEFKSQMGLRVHNSKSTGLELCFKLPMDSSEVEVQKLVLHFEGADLELPAENYIISDLNMGVAWLAMASSSGMPILGNLQQQNLLVLFNLDKETLSFLLAQCDQERIKA